MHSAAEIRLTKQEVTQKFLALIQPLVAFPLQQKAN